MQQSKLFFLLCVASRLKKIILEHERAIQTTTRSKKKPYTNKWINKYTSRYASINKYIDYDGLKLCFIRNKSHWDKGFCIATWREKAEKRWNENGCKRANCNIGLVCIFRAFVCALRCNFFPFVKLFNLRKSGVPTKCTIENWFQINKFNWHLSSPVLSLLHLKYIISFFYCSLLSSFHVEREHASESECENKP